LTLLATVGLKRLYQIRITHFGANIHLSYGVLLQSVLYFYVARISVFEISFMLKAAPLLRFVQVDTVEQRWHGNNTLDVLCNSNSVTHLVMAHNMAEKFTYFSNLMYLNTSLDSFTEMCVQIHEQFEDGWPLKLIQLVLLVGHSATIYNSGRLRIALDEIFVGEFKIRSLENLLLHSAFEGDLPVLNRSIRIWRYEVDATNLDFMTLTYNNIYDWRRNWFNAQKLTMPSLPSVITKFESFGISDDFAMPNRRYIGL